MLGIANLMLGILLYDYCTIVWQLFVVAGGKDWEVENLGNWGNWGNWGEGFDLCICQLLLLLLILL